MPNAQAFWLRAPGRGEIRPVVLPEPGRDDVVVRTLRTGVSRGTETLVFRGGVPPGQYDCLLYTSPSPRDGLLSRMPSSA